MVRGSEILVIGCLALALGCSHDGEDSVGRQASALSEARDSAVRIDSDAMIAPGTPPPQEEPLDPSAADTGEPQGRVGLEDLLDVGQPSDHAHVVDGYERGTATRYEPTSTDLAAAEELESTRLEELASLNDPVQLMAQYVSNDDISFVELELISEDGLSSPDGRFLSSWAIVRSISGASVPDLVVIEEDTSDGTRSICLSVNGSVGRVDLGIIERQVNGRYRFVVNDEYHPAHFALVLEGEYRAHGGIALPGSALEAAAAEWSTGR